MSNLKAVCKACKGKGKRWVDFGYPIGEDYTKCPDCDNGYTPPPQDVLDILECESIERELIAGGYLGKPDDLWEIRLNHHTFEGTKSFTGTTKLEAYRKAKEFIGR